MMIMPANNLSGIVHYFAGKYPGKIGLFLSPDSWCNPPYYFPYALDNGSFIKWEPDKFMRLLDRASSHSHKPLFVVVPDVVGNSDKTLERWEKWYPVVQSYGFNLAFACQDGMEPEKVPTNAYCCFIGGSTVFKLYNAHRFKGICKWLHVGRVSTTNRLKWAENFVKADSIDGTGFFRGPERKQCFINYFEGIEKVRPNLGLNYDNTTPT